MTRSSLTCVAIACVALLLGKSHLHISTVGPFNRGNQIPGGRFRNPLAESTVLDASTAIPLFSLLLLFEGIQFHFICISKWMPIIARYLNR